MEKRESSYTFGGNVSTATLDNSMEVPQKTKSRVTIWSSSPTARHKSRQNSNSKTTWTPKFIAVQFKIAKTWKQPKCSLADEWIKKMWYTGIMEYYSALKKEWNDVICSNMDGLRDDRTNILQYHV